jgi:hypothetical protein
MIRSRRSALVEHHPWLRRLSPNFPGSGLPGCNPGIRGSATTRWPRLRFTPGRRVR